MEYLAISETGATDRLISLIYGLGEEGGNNITSLLPNHTPKHGRRDIL